MGGISTEAPSPQRRWQRWAEDASGGEETWHWTPPLLERGRCELFPRLGICSRGANHVDSEGGFPDVEGCLYPWHCWRGLGESWLLGGLRRWRVL
ncbi:hypothetical protein U1Q18_049409 [Sarracenia purpurea var. burkii]